MLFSSTEFLFLFLPLVLLLYHVVFRNHRTQQNTLLLLASLFFYAWGEPYFVLIMLGSIASNYGLGLWVHHWKRKGKNLKLPLISAVTLNLGLLFVFKYLAFTLTTIGQVTGLPWETSIALPIGISFFTFQSLSYVLDVAFGTAEVQRSVFQLGLYISLFPQLIAGPIVKYSTVADQILHRRESWDQVADGCRRFMIGISKKVLLSNQLALLADTAWNLGPEQLSSSMAWLGSLCYTLQIYYDFSGYSDMAIGLGQMFGFQFLENFNYPYIATTVTEFWRRWHISLSSWFRDYVFIPLGGSRGTAWNLFRNLFVVWLLTGIWHGANWTFLMWGMFYFVLLCVEKFFDWQTGWHKGLKWFYTFAMVNFGWVLFRAPTISDANWFFTAMFGGSDPTQIVPTQFYIQQNWVLLFFSLLFALPVGKWLTPRITAYLNAHAKHIFPIWDLCYGLALLMLFLVTTSFLVKGTYNPFIYFNF